MSTFLYKISNKAFRKPWYFIVSWLAIVGLVATLLGINGIHISNEMKIEGTESQRVLDQLSNELPIASGGQGSVVFKASDDQRLDTPERGAAIGKIISEVYHLDYVVNTAELASGANDLNAMMMQNANPDDLPPYGIMIVDGMPLPGVLLSADGTIALFQFQFTDELTAIPQDVKDTIIETVTALEKEEEISVLPSESLLSLEIGIGSGEVIGLIVAAIVLLMTLGSVVAAGLPLLTALLGIAIGVGGAFSISSFIEMTNVSAILGLMIGLAVGIDYCLFIVNRQRRLIFDQGLSAQEAASRATGTAGSAVFFAGLTVIIALCGMLVMGISFLSTMALVAAATVLVNMLLVLTLLPALLGLVGEKICSPKARNKNQLKAANATRIGFSDRWVRGVVKFRWLVIVVVIVILGIAATPILKMDMGIPGAATANLDTAARQSYDAISEGFGEGFNGPLILVAELEDSSSKLTIEHLMGLVMELQSQDNVSQVSPLGINENGNLAIFSLIPDTGPTDIETKELVQQLRELDLQTGGGVTLGVTGFTAVNIDMSVKLGNVFPIYIGIIVILSLIILMLVFRSIVVPIKATLGFLLSILATFGITTAVFQWGWLNDVFGFDTGGPLLSFMPIVTTGILYGLAMDYQVFLVSSMRESYVHGHKGKESIVHGYNQASRVVLGAAVIMVSVFAGFIFTDDIMIKQIGFALTIGIFIDTFLVRMTLVPAVMAIFGEKAWWLPKWLDRILPNLDVEGDKLIAKLDKPNEILRKDQES
ncbi:MMPL family transporter [Paenibacillus crassostreae]|uniref:Transporter n=1 Tax=Paenibacillus crassostreae TaxID=1763538 RepID=A0A162KSL7_9BACL|nr:MMPL family transporter [Paenibacillus crassostreae]AOZ91814.1 transporter [Paenibacillus crassostreae]OAB73263.1 transporter [Paenibacillus crassostreae]